MSRSSALIIVGAAALAMSATAAAMPQVSVVDVQTVSAATEAAPNPSRGAAVVVEAATPARRERRQMGFESYRGLRPKKPGTFKQKARAARRGRA